MSFLTGTRLLREPAERRHRGTREQRFKSSLGGASRNLGVSQAIMATDTELLSHYGGRVPEGAGLVVVGPQGQLSTGDATRRHVSGNCTGDRARGD